MRLFAYLLLILTAATGLTSCSTDIDVAVPTQPPRVALSYTLSNRPTDGSKLEELFAFRQLYIATSLGILDPQEVSGRTDATVEIQNAAGTVVERFQPVPAGRRPENTPGLYRPTLGLVAQPGETYSLLATVPGLEPVQSTLIMPSVPVIENASFVLLGDNEDASPFNPIRGRLTVAIADNPDEVNYYLVFARVLNAQGQPGDWTPVRIDNQDPADELTVSRFQLSEAGGSSDSYVTPYPDTNANGQLITLTNNVSFYSGTCFNSTCPTLKYMEVFVSNITADAYKFYLSRGRNSDTDNNPFAEPAPLTSNIPDGYGLFGGATDVTYRITLR